VKVVTIVGARPQFIKCAAVSRALRRVATEVLVHTGQHYDDAMSDVFFRELEIPAPDYHLDVRSGAHGAQTGEMLKRVEAVLIGEQPDYVLVYGDTNSTLAGGLAAAKLHIPVAHVEAGLRSFNRRMPEEVNRVLTDHLATLHFCPTETAVANLAREGISQGVHRVGDVMYDATLYYRERAASQSTILQRLGLPPKGYLLATIHRAENTDAAERLRVIVDGLIHVARRIPVVVPLHPRTKAALQRSQLWDSAAAEVRLIDPAGYLDMVILEDNARLIATDSGGVQKEAFFCRVPCVTLRDETEWVELVEAGWNHLLSPVHGDQFAAALSSALDRPAPATAPALYGQGDAAVRLAAILAADSPAPAAA
jgi:UDP-GlcNAc3NAcA epimerase